MRIDCIEEILSNKDRDEGVRDYAALSSSLGAGAADAAMLALLVSGKLGIDAVDEEEILGASAGFSRGCAYIREKYGLTESVCGGCPNNGAQTYEEGSVQQADVAAERVKMERDALILMLSAPVTGLKRTCFPKDSAAAESKRKSFLTAPDGSTSLNACIYDMFYYTVDRRKVSPSDCLMNALPTDTFMLQCECTRPDILDLYGRTAMSGYYDALHKEARAYAAEYSALTESARKKARADALRLFKQKPLSVPLPTAETSDTSRTVNGRKAGGVKIRKPDDDNPDILDEIRDISGASHIDNDVSLQEAVARDEQDEAKPAQEDGDASERAGMTDGGSTYEPTNSDNAESVEKVKKKKPPVLSNADFAANRGYCDEGITDEERESPVQSIDDIPPCESTYGQYAQCECVYDEPEDCCTEECVKEESTSTDEECAGAVKDTSATGTTGYDLTVTKQWIDREGFTVYTDAEKDTRLLLKIMYAYLRSAVSGIEAVTVADGSRKRKAFLAFFPESGEKFCIYEETPAADTMRQYLASSRLYRKVTGSVIAVQALAYRAGFRIRNLTCTQEHEGPGGTYPPSEKVMEKGFGYYDADVWKEVKHSCIPHRELELAEALAWSLYADEYVNFSDAVYCYSKATGLTFRNLSGRFRKDVSRIRLVIMEDISNEKWKEFMERTVIQLDRADAFRRHAARICAYSVKKREMELVISPGQFRAFLTILTKINSAVAVKMFGKGKLDFRYETGRVETEK